MLPPARPAAALHAPWSGGHHFLEGRGGNFSPAAPLGARFPVEAKEGGRLRPAHLPTEAPLVLSRRSSGRNKASICPDMHKQSAADQPCSLRAAGSDPAEVRADAAFSARSAGHRSRAAARRSIAARRRTARDRRVRRWLSGQANGEKRRGRCRCPPTLVMSSTAARPAPPGKVYTEGPPELSSDQPTPWAIFAPRRRPT